MYYRYSIHGLTQTVLFLLRFFFRRTQEWQLLRPRLWNHPPSFCLSADKLRAHLKSWAIFSADKVGQQKLADFIVRLTSALG